jgi:hypothetical protein
VAAQALAQVIERVALEGKTWGPEIGPGPESVQEVSVVVIVLAVGQLPAGRAREPVRCRRTSALAQTTSVIGLSHRDPDSVRVTMLLAGVALTEAPLDRQVTAEVPAWEAVDSAMARAEAGALAEDAAAGAAGAEDRQRSIKKKQ